MLTNMTEWIKANVPMKDLLYKDGFSSQIHFVKEQVATALARSYEEWRTIYDENSQLRLQVTSISMFFSG